MRAILRALSIVSSFGLFIVLLNPINAFGAPAHFWSQRFGDVGGQVSRGIATDSFGRVVITGHFQGTVDFGGGPLTDAGNFDIFVAKFDATGGHLWSKRFGNTDMQVAWSVATDAAGNTIITGNFYGTVDFGGGPLTANAHDIFIAKFDPNGDHLWSKRFGNGANESFDVATDAAGNVIVTGYYIGEVDFGGGVLTSAGGFDVFVAKLDPNGNHIWSKRFGDVYGQLGRSVVLDTDGNVLVSGAFEGTVDFGGGVLTSAGSFDGFIAKFDPNGDHLWSRRFGDVYGVSMFGLATDAAGNVFATGLFQGTVDFGGGGLTSQGLDAFFAKFDAAGTHLWSKRFGDASNQEGRDIGIDSFGNALLIGSFAGAVDFGGGVLADAGGGDLYLAAFDQSGAHIWSKRFGDSQNQSNRGVSLDASDNIFMMGNFGGAVDFGGGALTSAGDSDIFIAKFGQEQPVPTFVTRFEALPAEGNMMVRWELQSDETVEGFSLFRRVDPTPVSSIIADDLNSSSRSFMDRNVEPGKTYYYELLIRTADGSEFRSPVATAATPRTVTALAQNFPNPFNPQTTIAYTVSARTPISVEIFDASGARIRVLGQGVREAGSYSVEWDGRDAGNQPVSSGVYFYRLSGIKGAETRKMVLVK